MARKMRKISKHELMKLLILLLSIAGIMVVTLVVMFFALNPELCGTGGTGDGG
jgi:hypothetical protein